MAGRAKIAKVNNQVWVTVSADEDFLKGLAEEAKGHGFEAELDLSWKPTLFLRHPRVNINYLKQALQAKGLEVVIL